LNERDSLPAAGIGIASVSIENTVCQVTLFEAVTRDECGTAWLRVYEGCRYFDVSIGGVWQGRVTLEIQPVYGVDSGRNDVKCLQVFDRNTRKLFCLDSDAEVRLWIRKGDLKDGEVMLELGN
jgi:hypothetical protein